MRLTGISLLAALALSACGAGGVSDTELPAQLETVSVPLRADAPNDLKIFTQLCSAAAQDGISASLEIAAEDYGLYPASETMDDTKSFKLDLDDGANVSGRIKVDAVKTACTAFVKPSETVTDVSSFITAFEGLEGYRGQLQTVQVGETPQQSGLYNGVMADERVIVLNANGGADFVLISMLVGLPKDLK